MSSRRLPEVLMKNLNCGAGDGAEGREAECLETNSETTTAIMKQQITTIIQVLPPFSAD